MAVDVLMLLLYKVRKMKQRAVQMEQNSAYGMVHGEGMHFVSHAGIVCTKTLAKKTKLISNKPANC